MRRLVLACGYNAASVRERIYARNPNEDDQNPEPMAGILIYTAAPDSEGTLGWLAWENRNSSSTTSEGRSGTPCSALRTRSVPSIHPAAGG